MNFKNLIYSAIIVASLNLINIAAYPLFVNGWEVPEHLTNKAREFLNLGPEVVIWEVDNQQLKKLVAALMNYQLEGNDVTVLTKEEWRKLKDKNIL